MRQYCEPATHIAAALIVVINDDINCRCFYLLLVNRCFCNTPFLLRLLLLLWLYIYSAKPWSWMKQSLTRLQLRPLRFSSLLLHRNTEKKRFSCTLLLNKKEMASTAVRFVTFVSALMLLMHCAYAAPAPIFQQRQSAKTWCVANPSAEEVKLRANLDYACSQSDCSAITGTGGCSVLYGGRLLSRASVAMNAYYQAMGGNSWNCFFNGTGLITITDPSLGTCKYA